MPNIAALLKAEISRVARKEVRTETASLKKAVSLYRTEIAALKRRAQVLEAQVRRQRALHARGQAKAEPEESLQARRFSAKGFMALRKRLDLSAQDFGLLVGASSQSIYNWEAGKARPRAGHLETIAAMRGWGKKQASTRLAAVRKTG